MSKGDLKSYWMKAIQDMSDAEIAAFDLRARAFVPTPIKPLPKKAPKLWVDAKAEDSTLTPPEFLARFWGPWMDGISFHRGEYREYDPVGERALQNWLTRNKYQWPEGIYLPTKGEALDRREAGSALTAMRHAMRLRRRER